MIAIERLRALEKRWRSEAWINVACDDVSRVHADELATLIAELGREAGAGKCEECGGFGEVCLAGRSAHPSNWHRCEACCQSSATSTSHTSEARDVVSAELERAVRKFPTWPTDPLHAVAVLGEEFGELTKAVLQSVYEPHKVKPGEVRTEAVQTAAMALRFLQSLDAYVYSSSEQHSQDAAMRREAE